MFHFLFYHAIKIIIFSDTKSKAQQTLIMEESLISGSFVFKMDFMQSYLYLPVVRDDDWNATPAAAMVL
jgi:hypothetical protein